MEIRISGAKYAPTPIVPSAAIPTKPGARMMIITISKKTTRIITPS